MSDTHGHHGGDASLAGAVRELTGLNPAKCYQCGKCSAGCPMAAETRLRPHDVMRLVVADRRDRLFGDESIWLCLTCETCSARCPNEVEPARIIDALREIAGREHADGAPKPIRAFHDAFLKQIRKHGRLFELGLIMGYKFRSGQLFRDATTAPGMMSRGKLHFAPKNIDGVEEVRRIFDACAAGHKEEA